MWGRLSHCCFLPPLGTTPLRVVVLPVVSKKHGLTSTRWRITPCRWPPYSAAPQQHPPDEAVKARCSSIWPRPAADGGTFHAALAGFDANLDCTGLLDVLLERAGGRPRRTPVALLAHPSLVVNKAADPLMTMLWRRPRPRRACAWRWLRARCRL